MIGCDPFVQAKVQTAAMVAIPKPTMAEGISRLGKQRIAREFKSFLITFVRRVICTKAPFKCLRVIIGGGGNSS